MIKWHENFVALFKADTSKKYYEKNGHNAYCKPKSWFKQSSNLFILYKSVDIKSASIKLDGEGGM